MSSHQGPWSPTSAKPGTQLCLTTAPAPGAAGSSTPASARSHEPSSGAKETGSPVAPPTPQKWVGKAGWVCRGGGGGKRRGGGRKGGRGGGGQHPVAHHSGSRGQARWGWCGRSTHKETRVKCDCVASFLLGNRGCISNSFFFFSFCLGLLFQVNVTVLFPLAGAGLGVPSPCQQVFSKVIPAYTHGELDPVFDLRVTSSAFPWQATRMLQT